MSERNSASGSEYAASQGPELEPEPEPGLTRPNRWNGAPTTWLSITEQERGLAASLDELRNRDLSVHLYNAHQLRKRAANLESLARIGKKVEDPIAEDADEPFVPPKSWTAWPLPPEEVPRKGEQVGEEDPDDQYTFKRSEPARPSRELEDILMGLALKLAKEKFEAREWASEDEDLDDNEEDNSDQASDVMIEDDDSDGGSGNPAIKEGSEHPPTKAFMRPVVSADDERSRELLRPTIRHNLSKLDDVLMALHHARQTCRRYSSYSEANTDDDSRSISVVDDPASPTKRLKGRPRKFENLTHRSKPDKNQEGQDMESSEILRPKKPGRGRKPKQYPRLEDETEEEYHIRVARLQKKPLPVFAPPREINEEEPPLKRHRAKTPTPRINRSSPEKAASKHQSRLGLRDWSEVLGSAALVGFPPDVIARATQRCANLFGEGMSMRTMFEVPFGAENTGALKSYQPEEIPDLGLESDDSEESFDAGSQDADYPKGKARHRSRQSKALGVAPHTQICFCPVKDCARQKQGFSSQKCLRRHLKRGHKMTNEEIAEFDIPSDEEMDGAVHVDGFLKPEKRALRGKDRTARKRKKKADNSESDDLGEDTGVARSSSLEDGEENMKNEESSSEG